MNTQIALELMDGEERNYCEDPYDAWLVVEKLKKRGYAVTVRIFPDGSEVLAHKNNKSFYQEDPSNNPSFAICELAMKILDYENSLI